MIRPVLRRRVLILGGLYRGRQGEVQEVNEGRKKVRVRADGMMARETVELDWAEIADPLQVP